METERTKLFDYTTLEIVFMALVGVVFGVLFAFSAPINMFLVSILGVWGESIIGWYMLPQALAVLIIRKRGVYFITTGVNMISQALAGNPAGFLPIVGWWLVGGTAGELALWLAFRYKNLNFWKVAFAVSMNLLFNWPVTAYFYGWGTQGVLNNIFGTATQMVVFAAESGGLAVIFARILHRAGLLGGYQYARDMRGKD